MICTDRSSAVCAEELAVAMVWFEERYGGLFYPVMDRSTPFRHLLTRRLGLSWLFAG
ncbi:hypothetical protein [Micromonospora sp. C81]|uniref:hypothetical protein n=1 Tax=Micromonospora sp. C81 TaxID=2824881 RepID=UPI001B3861EC|nr:hypothetical protein [Micromonospora sp. C81]MBQ1036304.1 hypothetical protein [Micromonospora sp. C81]